MSNDPALSELICNFIYTTIIWHESRYYNICSTCDENLKNLKNIDEMQGLIAFSITKNMNNIYKDVLNNSSQNQQVLQLFKDMKKASDCTTLCLINLIYYSLLSVHKKIKRECLITSTENDYIKSISDQLIVLLNDLAAIIQPRVCKGCINESHNNKPIFSLENTLKFIMQ